MSTLRAVVAGRRVNHDRIELGPDFCHHSPMANCIFCRIVRGEIPADVVGENELYLAFNDIRPKAPVHVLIIPKIHRERPAELTADEIHQMLQAADAIATQKNVKDSGYRLTFNVGKHAGQEVEHVHLHLLGGRPSAGMF